MNTEKDIVRSSQRKIFAKAERELGRPFTDTERNAVLSLEHPQVLAEVAAWDGKDIVEFLGSAFEDTRTVELLRSLAASPGPVHSDRQRILAFFDPRARQVLHTFSFEEASQRFDEWVLLLVQRNPLPKTTRALRFGLYESRGGYTLYACAADHYDPQPALWSEVNTWRPEGREVVLEALSKLWRPLRRTGAEPWIAIQAIVIALAKAFFTVHDVAFKQATGLRRLFVISGFDDGD